MYRGRKHGCTNSLLLQPMRNHMEKYRTLFGTLMSGVPSAMDGHEQKRLHTPFASDGPQHGEESNRLQNACCLGLPKVGRNITPAVLGCPKRGAIAKATQPLAYRGSQRKEESKRLHNLCCIGWGAGGGGGARAGRNQRGYKTLAILRSPNCGGINTVPGVQSRGGSKRL